MTLTLPPWTNAQILTRAPLVWGVQTVDYDMGSTDTPTGHRADCSGYVSAVLGLAAPGLTTDTLAALGVLVPIAWDQIQPGDQFMIPLPGADGHVAIFVRWIDQTSKVAAVWEQSGGRIGPHQSVWVDPQAIGYTLYRYANNHPHQEETMIGKVTNDKTCWVSNGINRRAMSMQSALNKLEAAGQTLIVFDTADELADAFGPDVATSSAGGVDQAALEAAAAQGAHQGAAAAIDGATIHAGA